MSGQRRILLLGATGLVGRELNQTLPALGEVLAPPRAVLDVTDTPRLVDFVRDKRPEVIVNAAAYAAVDPAEDEPERAFALNAALPRALAEVSAHIGSLLVHYSTDYVFDGSKHTPYVETDLTHPINAYGETKLAGERAIGDVAARHIILRTSFVYGGAGQTLFARVRQHAQAQSAIRVVTDLLSSPTWSRRLAEATCTIVRQLMSAVDSKSGADPWGIYHLVGSGATSRYDFARATLALELGEDAAARLIVPVTSREFAARAARPPYSVLDSTKVADRFGIAMPFWRDDLALLLGGQPISAG